MRLAHIWGSEMWLTKLEEKQKEKRKKKKEKKTRENFPGASTGDINRNGTQRRRLSAVR